MAEIIINWLKTFPDISEQILTNNLENIFSNGYNFGKIFNSHNLFPDMKILKNNEDKYDSFKNYVLLSKIFKQLGITLAEEDIVDLINKKSHKAELFLYKIRQSLLLNKIQFKEIINKLEAESQSKLKDNIEIRDKNKNLLNRYKSAKRRSEPIIQDKKAIRLQSAKLPVINLDNKRIKNYNIYNDNDLIKEENEKLEIKQMQAVINDITIFENIHMNKKQKKSSKKNPWDEVNYIYDNKDLLNKDKDKLSKKKFDFLELIKTKNKKEKEKIEKKKKKKKKYEEKIWKIKSSLNNYNQFKVDNKKKYLNKTNLEKGLSLMGLNSANMFPSILKVKGNKIPTELIMKSINDQTKDKLKKDNELNKTYTKLQNEEKEEKKHRIIKPPVSAKGNVSKNIKLETNSSEKENQTKYKRPLTGKYPKRISDKKKSSQKEKEKNKKSIDSYELMKEKKFSLNDTKSGLARIEETIKTETQNSIPSSKISNIKIEEDEYSKIKYKKENTLEIKKPTKELTEEEKRKQIEQKKKEYIYDQKNMREIISSIIDITEIYYEYQNNMSSEFIDLENWNKISYNFIHNKNIVKRKKQKKVVTEEEKSNLNFNVYDKLDEKYSKNFGEIEKNELKNYLFYIGKKYDKNKNNLFVKKLGLKPASLEINDIMGEEIEILFNKALAEGKDARDEEDEEEVKKTGKIKYRPSREEE